MIEKVLETNWGNIYYWISETQQENTDTLVFLHGLTADHNLFNHQVPFFENKYNLIVWDAPAHGKSRPYKDFTYPHAAESLLGILDVCKVDKAVLIGQSLGGFISQAFLARYPDRVKAFISIDSCPYGEIYYSKPDKFWLRQVEWLSYCYPLKSMKKAVAKQCTTTPASRQNMLKMHEPYGKRELCHLMGVGYAGFLEDNRNLEIQCPTLLIVGEKDVTGKVIHYNKIWSERTGFTLKFIENAAHNSNDDNPKQVNSVIEGFLQTI